VFGITNQTRVYLRTGVTDGRLGYEGLRGLTVKVIQKDPLGGHLFCFCNGARNRIKFLWWDGTGFFIAAKRLPRGTFDFPKNPNAVAQMSIAQLQVLLRGVEFTRPNGGYRR
jgi:transposase